MKPTPTQIEAAFDAYLEGVYLTEDQAKASVIRIVTAALSVPAAAVVGEPVGYVSAPELVHLKMGVSCVDLFREPQPGGIDFAPVYAAPSATEGHAVVEPVAFHVKVKGYGEELCFTEDGANSLVQRIRRTKGQHGVATITPLYATLPNEALERSEQATFDIAARLLKERDALASRISQQDAELERLRREVEALRVLSFSGNALVQIVEGLQGSMEHGTWRDEKGMRLKDTNAWCLFYTTFKASAQAAKAEDTAR